MRKRKRIETSKLLLWVLLGGLVIIMVCALLYTFLLHDSSPLVTAIECYTKLSSIAIGFYYWKAKNENLHKYKQDHKIGDIQE